MTIKIFLNVMECNVKPGTQIYNQLVDMIVQANKHKLLSILKTLILCAIDDSTSFSCDN